MWKSSRRIALFSTFLALGGAVFVGVALFTDWLPIEFREPNAGRLADSGIPDDLSWATIDDVSVDLGEPGPIPDEQSEPVVGSAEPETSGFRTRVEQFAQSNDLPPASFNERRESFNVDSRFPDQFPNYDNSSRPAVSSNSAPARNVSVSASSDLAEQPPLSRSRFDAARFGGDEPFRGSAVRRESDSRELPSKLAQNEVASRESILLTGGEASAATEQPAADNQPPSGATPERPLQTASRVGQTLPAADDSAGQVSQIDAMLSRGEYIAAHREMSNIYWRQPEQRPLIMSRLKENAATIYFNPQPHFLPPYELQSGDLLQRVAPKYGLSWQYLAKLNHISDPSRIRAGQKLKIIKGPFSAFVDLSDFELTIHAHGFFVKRYSVGIGQDGSSPVGKFKVLEKIPTPQYTDPDGRVIAGGASDNPLGPFWIDLGDSYGIHGTIDPNSIGKAESRGCIRMRNEDVAEVYDFLITGSEVVIRP
ncbi:L,D-transpeptidase family protein [bacterium]|nr:L,D-transpeptidase family protein [bacterium]